MYIGIPIATALLALVTAIILAVLLTRRQTSDGSVALPETADLIERMRQISGAIQEGAQAFLRREYSVLVPFVGVMTVVLGAFIGWRTAVSYLIGAVFSALAGYLGMSVAVRANWRTTATLMPRYPASAENTAPTR